MNASNILILFSNSPYHEQHYYASAISSCLEQLSFHVTLINTDSDISESALQATILQLAPDLIFTLGLSGFHLQMLGDDLFLNGAYCPCVHLLTRHPAYDAGYLSQRMNFTMFFYSHFTEYATYIEHFFKRVPNVAVLPFYQLPVTTIKSFEDRTIDLYYPSSYIPSKDILSHIKSLPEVFSNICMDVIQAMQNNTDVSLHECLYEYLDKIHFSLSDDEFNEIMQTMQLVELYIKSLSSEHYISLLLENGYDVTVSGENWNQFSLNSHTNLHIIGEHGLNYYEAINTMCNSKSILNLQFHKNSGIHPRVISALSSHVNCVTNENKQISEIIGYGNIFTFKTDEDFLHQIDLAIHHPFTDMATSFLSDVLSDIISNI